MYSYYKDLGDTYAKNTQAYDLKKIKSADFSHLILLDWSTNAHNGDMNPIIELFKNDIDNNEFTSIQKIFINFSINLKKPISEIIEEIIEYRTKNLVRYSDSIANATDEISDEAREYAEGSLEENRDICGVDDYILKFKIQEKLYKFTACIEFDKFHDHKDNDYWCVGDVSVSHEEIL